MISQPILELHQINKSFGHVQANKEVSLKIKKGDIHGIVGENGAGKSTLMSIVYGYYQAAGGTGIGVLQAAADAGIFGIGVDANQNYMHPGSVLTSMLKRVDVAVYNAFKTTMDGTYETGVFTLGLAEDCVGWALDEHNASLITDEMKSAVEQAREDIISGKIVVADASAQ